MTFLEMLKIDHPEEANAKADSIKRGCPDEYGYEFKSKCSTVDGDCTKCWNREIPGTEKIEKENNTMRPKTKDELMAELKEAQNTIVKLTDELKQLEKYKSLTQAADELKRIHDVFVNSGFTPDQAIVLVNTLLANCIESLM